MVLDAIENIWWMQHYEIQKNYYANFIKSTSLYLNGGKMLGNGCPKVINPVAGLGIALFRRKAAGGCFNLASIPM